MCDITEPISTFTTFTAGSSLQDIFSNEDVSIPIVAMGIGALIAVCAIVCGTMKAIFTTKSREATKRELAAYVAEGSLDPDKAVAMINAGRPHWEVGKHGSKGGGCC